MAVFPTKLRPQIAENKQGTAKSLDSNVLSLLSANISVSGSVRWLFIQATKDPRTVQSF